MNEGVHKETKLRNSLRFSISKSRLSSKFLGWPSSYSLEEDMLMWRPNISFKSPTQCLQVTYDLYFALMIYKLDSCKKVYYTSFLLSFTPGCGVLFPSKLKVQLWYSNMQLWLSNTQFWIWLSLELLTELWYSDIPLRHSKLNQILGFSVSILKCSFGVTWWPVFGVKPSRAGHHSPTI